MESLIVMIAAILWTIGRYRLCTPSEWRAKHWLMRGSAITLALFPVFIFWHWDKFITSSLFSSTNDVIYCQISMHLFLIVVGIQATMGLVFIVSTMKNRS